MKLQVHTEVVILTINKLTSFFFISFTEDSEFGEESTEPTVRDSMGYYIPQPPPKPEKQGPGQDISEILGSHLTEAEKQQEMRKDFRSVCNFKILSF